MRASNPSWYPSTCTATTPNGKPTISGKGPDDWRVRRFRMSAPGATTPQDLQLLPGNTYTFALKYLHTKPGEEVPWYCWEASIGGQTAPAFTLNGQWLVDNSSALLADHSHSQGENKVKEKKPVTLAPSDLDLIKPGTETDTTPSEIAEDKEDSEGGVATVNWDDDNNSEGPGKHGKVDYKSDFADPGETKSENDLIQLKLHKAAAGITARLKYANTHLKLWQTATRTGEVLSETTVFDLAADRIVYIEGRKLTPSGQPVEIAMQVKAAADTPYQPGDTVKVHVATPVIFLSGVNPGMSGVDAFELEEAAFTDTTILGKLRVDKRSNTVVLKGKDLAGADHYYSIDVFTAISENMDLWDHPVREVTSDKEMKMARSRGGRPCRMGILSGPKTARLRSGPNGPARIARPLSRRSYHILARREPLTRRSALARVSIGRFTN